MDLRHCRIDASDVTRPTIEVDGVDVTPVVCRAVFDMRLDDVPRLHLEIAAQGVTEAQALVLPMQQPILEWLDSIDPAMLEKVALQYMRTLNTSTGAGFMAALRELVPS